MPYLDPNSKIFFAFGRVGKNVFIDDSVVILQPELVFLESNIRIDAFCMLNPSDGEIRIGNFFHMASHGIMVGGGGIHIGDHVGISHGVALLSQSDSFDGRSIGGPWNPSTRNVTKKKITLEGRNLIGAQSLVLPGGSMELDSRLGAKSLLTKQIPKSKLAAGVPAKIIAERL